MWPRITLSLPGISTKRGKAAIGSEDGGRQCRLLPNRTTDPLIRTASSLAKGLRGPFRSRTSKNAPLGFGFPFWSHFSGLFTTPLISTWTSTRAALVIRGQSHLISLALSKAVVVVPVVG